MKGYKRCKCRDGDGRELGNGCPDLRRRDGSWNPAHGTWYGKAELPPSPDGQRAALRAGGFATQAEMGEWFEEAMHLLSVPEKGTDGHDSRAEILALIRESRKKKAALPRYDDIKRRYSEGIAFAPGTTGDYLAGWLERHRTAEDWSASTLLSYERATERLFLPHLGKIPLDRLQSRHILDMFAAIDAASEALISARGSDDPAVRASAAGKRPTGLSTKKRILAVLRSALAEASDAQHRLITANPAVGVKLGRASRKGKTGAKAKLWTAERERAWREDYEARVTIGGKSAFHTWRTTSARPGPVMIWKPAQLGRFLDAAEGDRLYALFCVVAFCGLRRGEATGLRWEDADFDAGAIMISRQIVQVGWKPVITGEAKAEASEEWVKLADQSTAALRAWRRRQLEERVRWGRGWNDTGFAFTHEDGTPYHPAQVTARFERIAFGAGLPPIRFHDLRHGAATLALAAGQDIKAVSAMMRHSSVKITADIYASVLPELAAEVSSAVESMVPRAAASGTDGLPTVSLARTRTRAQARRGE